MNKYPLLIKAFPREIIWGGTKLKRKYNKEAPFDNIAESWEISTRDGSLSLIDNGEYSGMSLKEYLQRSCTSFNLLIKYIDAESDLSVQVHPDDSIKDEFGNSLGKTEIWHIIEAEDDAQLVYGLKDGVTLEEFKSSIFNGNTEKCLNYIKVKKGETYFIPAGLVHAICKGILIAEIQQNSDTTYRIYDYERKDKNGKARELHIDQALNVIKCFTPDEIKAMQYSKNADRDTLSSCDKFEVKKLYIENETTIPACENSYTIMCTDGSGIIVCNDIEYPIQSGVTYFIPENTGIIKIIGQLNTLLAKE